MRIACAPVSVNVYGAQESILPAYVAWRAGTTKRVARNFKRLRSPRIDSKEPIPPVILRSLGIDSKETIPSGYMKPGGSVRQPSSYSVSSPHRLFKNSSTGPPGWELILGFLTKIRALMVHVAGLGMN